MSRIRQKNQDLIIEVACEQFATHGYAATKMADIAKAADIPKPNVFYYFSSKDKLYNAVLETVTQLYLKHLVQLKISAILLKPCLNIFKPN